MVIADPKPEGVDAAVALVRAAQALGFALNVTDRGLDHGGCGEVRFDGIDVLVNNAGITKGRKVPEDDAGAVRRGHRRQPARRVQNATQAVLPAMLAQGASA